MNASYSFKNNFHNVRVVAPAGDFMRMLNSVVEKYDDGQGREYDILDSEVKVELEEHDENYF